MDEWTNERMNWFCRPHFPKVPRRHLFLKHFETQIELSLQSRAHFANFIFPKCSDPLSCLTVRFLKANRALAIYNVVHFLLTTFPDRGSRDYFGDPQNHVTRKGIGFRPEERFHLWIHPFPNYYTSQQLNYTMMVGWQNDVVDMMLAMLTMTIARKSEVF